MKNKKMVIILLFILFLSLVVSLILVFFKKKEEQKSVNRDIIIQEKEENIPILEESKEETEEQKNITEEKNNESGKDVEIDSENNQSSNDNNKVNNSITNINSDENKTNEIKQDNEIIKVKEVCSSNNNQYGNYLNSWKQQNPYSSIFSSREKAMDYASYANSDSFGYGYWISQEPLVYSDDECSIELWAVTLYIGVTTCTDSEGNYSKKMNLPATSQDELINKYQYLTNLGYDCSHKSW